jgi:hypothetical protein
MGVGSGIGAPAEVPGSSGYQFMGNSANGVSESQKFTRIEDPYKENNPNKSYNERVSASRDRQNRGPMPYETSSQYGGAS